MVRSAIDSPVSSPSPTISRSACWLVICPCLVSLTICSLIWRLTASTRISGSSDPAIAPSPMRTPRVATRFRYSSIPDGMIRAFCSMFNSICATAACVLTRAAPVRLSSESVRIPRSHRSYSLRNRPNACGLVTMVGSGVADLVCMTGARQSRNDCVTLIALLQVSHISFSSGVPSGAGRCR